MRIAVMGAAAAAMLGGTLAVMPISTVSTPMRSAGCGAGCERLASVLIPAPDAPSGAAQSGTVQPVAAHPAPAQASSAANVIAPGVSPEPGEPSAASAVPGVGG